MYAALSIGVAVVVVIGLGLFGLGPEGCLHSGLVSFERTEHLSAPMAPGGEFATELTNGSIAVTAGDAEGCRVVAAVRARAATEELAREYAENTAVSLVPADGRLLVQVEQPRVAPQGNVSVDLRVEVPEETNLDLRTQNGPVEVSGIRGQVDATTRNGQISVSDTAGPLTLRSTNGPLVASGIAGDADLSTRNGFVTVTYQPEAPSPERILLWTQNGNVELTPPRELSAQVEMHTRNGRVRCDVPIQLSRSERRHAEGVVGSGEGRVSLTTTNGSVRLLAP